MDIGGGLNGGVGDGVKEDTGGGANALGSATLLGWKVVGTVAVTS